MVAVDEQLVRRAIRGDVLAYEQLIDAQEREIAGIAHAESGLTRDDLADLIQDIRVAAWESLPRIDSPERFHQWLHAVARNQARMARRKHRRYWALRWWPFANSDDTESVIDAQPADSSTEPEAVALGKAGVGEVTKVMERLSPKRRTAFRLRALTTPPHSYDEIGESIGTGPTGARVAYSRACKQLGKWLMEDKGK